ncbi:MAG: class I SAM-dependent DNA methyltransferase [Lachnospira sp.]
MEAYTGFAYVYDEYMDNIPYEEWGQYLIQLLKEQNIKPESVLCDLGCGTGTVTRMLDEEGYECIGLDLSEDMLSIASEKMYDEERSIIYSCQDMRDFKLPYKVDAFVSIGDSMNYITSVKDMTEVFKCVEAGLEKGGVFIFDLKTIHFFRDILADNTYAENREDSAFIWDNYYNEEDGNNEYDLAVFIRNEDGSFERFEENHYQHGFTRDEVKRAVEDAGLRIKAVYDAFTHNEPEDDSERLYYIIEK